MYSEVAVTTIILLLCWVAFLLLDTVISGLLAWWCDITFKRAFLWGLLSLLIPVVVIGYGMLIERNRCEVKQVELTYDSLPDAFDGYRIVHISDIHSRSFRHRTGALQKIVDEINALNPHLILFTGDLITINPNELDKTAPILAQLTAPDGVVSVLGNHDYCTRMGDSKERKPNREAMDDLMQRQRDMGWMLLNNASRLIVRDGDTIAIVGVENMTPMTHFPSTGDLQKASQGTEGLFRILLCHDPMSWSRDVVGEDYPLTLSGHTHAMQFSLFGWCPSKYVFEQYRGLYSHGTQYLYVNIGLGETIFPARIGAPPEITLITLKKSHQYD